MMGNVEKYRQKEVKHKAEGDKVTCNKKEDSYKSKVIKNTNTIIANISLMKASVLAWTETLEWKVEYLHSLSCRHV